MQLHQTLLPVQGPGTKTSYHPYLVSLLLLFCYLYILRIYCMPMLSLCIEFTDL